MPYTLQDVIAISVLYHGLIYFLCTKSESQPESMEKTDSRKAAYASFCLLFSCFQVGIAILQSCEKDFLYLNVRGY